MDVLNHAIRDRDQVTKSKVGISHSGFTLVELMITVAIISMLASIAIPNYLMFVASARATEAEAQLSAVYDFEQSFYAEYGSYTVCLENIGYSPSTGAPTYYAVGFNGDSSTCGDGSQDCDGSGWAPTFLCSAPTVGVLGAPPASWWTASVAAGGNLPAGCADVSCSSVQPLDLPSGSISNTQFSISASGRIYSDVLDIWNINSKDQIIHKQFGY